MWILAGITAFGADLGDVDIHGVARGALNVEVDEKGERLGAAMELARLQVKWAPHPVVSSMVQVEGASGTVQLLDAMVRLGAAEGPQLRAGRFKVPVGAELQLPAPILPTRNRALLTDLAPRRAVGMAVGWRLPSAEISVGVFDPAGLARPDEVGVQLTVAGDFEVVENLKLHVSGGVWPHPSGIETTLQDRTPTHDRQVDVGLAYDDGRTSVSTELLGAQATSDRALTGGLRAVVARRFPLRHDLELQPAVGWDSLGWETWEHRGTAALNLWFMERLVAVSLSHRSALDEQGWRHCSGTSVQVWL